MGFSHGKDGAEKDTRGMPLPSVSAATLGRTIHDHLVNRCLMHPFTNPGMSPLRLTGH